jgi:integrase
VSTWKPKNSPYYQFDFVWKGQRYYGTTGCRTKRDADAYEARERQKAILGGQQRPPITLDEACGLYQDKAEEQPSWATTRYMMAALIEGLGGDRRLSDISQRDLLHYFSRRRDGRTNATVNREIENARAIWRWAGKQRYDVGEMPDWGALFLKVPRADPRELSASEETALFPELREDIFDFCQFALKAGWRKAELLGLRWTDLDMNAAVAETRIKGGDVVKRPLTQEMVIIIANQPKVGPFVFTYVAQANKSEVKRDKLGRKHPARQKGERYPMTATVLRKPWKAALEAAQIERFRFHDLRHTRGTRILRATGNLAAAKEALKHRSIKTTLRYAHATDDDVRNALEASESRTIPEQGTPKKQKG